jgi:cbb3-type cytochrome oxidase cytochrome c subunit
MTNAQRRLAWLLCLALGGLLPGCYGSAPAGPVQTDTGPFTGGRKVFAEVGCSRCHTVNRVRLVAANAPAPDSPPDAGGPPGPGGIVVRKGPDLGKVARDPAHTPDWFMKYVRQPRDVDPNTHMPAFGEAKIKDDDLRTLAEYLATLK